MAILDACNPGPFPLTSVLRFPVGVADAATALLSLLPPAVSVTSLPPSSASSDGETLAFRPSASPFVGGLFSHGV